jgi:hypothetical protein
MHFNERKIMSNNQTQFTPSYEIWQRARVSSTYDFRHAKLVRLKEQ